MQRNAGDHEPDTEQLARGRPLTQHEDADRRGHCGQQRDHERVGRPRQPGEGELIGDVGDDRRAHADAGAGEQQARMVDGGQRRPESERRRQDGRDEHRGGEAIDSAHARSLRQVVSDDDVGGEQRRVREREGEAERGRVQLDVGEHSGAGHGQDERGRVARPPSAKCGERDHRDELDRGDGPEREPVDRQVEAAIHRGEHAAPGEHEPPGLRSPRPDGPPGTPPSREHDRGRGDPQPGDPEDRDVREQQHGECRSKVVEHGADDKERVRRHGTSHAVMVADSAPSLHG